MANIGDSVLAYWEKAGAYFIGTVIALDTSVAGGGFRIVFEDGDEGVVAAGLVRGVALGPGTKVMARWSDGQFYPGTVARVVGRAFFVRFDDGDEGWVAASGIAVKT